MLFLNKKISFKQTMMNHLSEDSRQLTIHVQKPSNRFHLLASVRDFGDVCFLRLPLSLNHDEKRPLEHAGAIVAKVSELLGEGATLIVFGSVIDLVHLHDVLSKTVQYQLWIAIKRASADASPVGTSLPHEHVGAVVYTKYKGPLRHTKTRIAYSYCPACGKTTKDYGGKKHTYHSYGTLMSDVWRDITVSPDNDIDDLVIRFADLFGLSNYQDLNVYDLSTLLSERASANPVSTIPKVQVAALESELINGDCLVELKAIPDNSVDFAFADPPYNLKKEYRGYADDLNIAEYFAWCDKWISQVARVLRPGCTFALLNMPLWAIRHFLHLESVLEFQNWIVWDALSFPVRMIMPAHYTILCFTKGEPRRLPGLLEDAQAVSVANSSRTFDALAPLSEGYCLRPKCVTERHVKGQEERESLSDIWWDIHRLKHNTRRVSHPCQLPPQLMYRLISLFTNPDETVLDCFNGAGTTTLCAHQLKRKYIGIERDLGYHNIALRRHEEINQGLDPFRKEERDLGTRNRNRDRRQKKQKYEVPKKTLQLEVRRVALLLNHIPSRDDMIAHGVYPIRYYDEYFKSWAEVCAAARTTGMSDTREDDLGQIYSYKRSF